MIDPRDEPVGARAGFTLIELLVVVVVVGLLAAIAIPRYRTATHEAYRSTMTADMRNLATKQELFHHMNFRYGSLADLDDYLASNGVTITLSDVSNAGFGATATHEALPGYVCGYYIGDASPTAPATMPEQLTCN